MAAFFFWCTLAWYLKPFAGIPTDAYSPMLSISDVAPSGADVVGSYLADHDWQFADLVYLNAGTTAIALILLPLLPAALMRSKDTAG